MFLQSGCFYCIPHLFHQMASEHHLYSIIVDAAAVMIISLAVLTILLFRITNLMSLFNILQLAFASQINLWLILCKCGTQIQQIAGGSDMKLRVSLDNLLAAEQVGRWWIVGSSWSGAPMINKEGNETSKHSTAEGQVVRVFLFCCCWWVCLFPLSM